MDGPGLSPLAPFDDDMYMTDLGGGGGGGAGAQPPQPPAPPPPPQPPAAPAAWVPVDGPPTLREAQTRIQQMQILVDELAAAREKPAVVRAAHVAAVNHIPT